jgi:CRISPR-associated protein Csb2
MNRALCVSATFVTGRYHGQEWPPSPARLMQALLAGVMTGGYRALRPRVEPALRWLERQPAPEILAVTADSLRPYRLAVPNNDMDAVGREWAAGRAANPAELRTMKLVQPRGVNGSGPHVIYIWPVADTPEEAGQLLDAARSLAHCLHTFGWGIDMSYADAALLQSLRPNGRYERWKPSRAGEGLAVPAPGFLDDLDRTHQRFVSRASGAGIDADTRPAAYRLQRYARAGDRRPRHTVFALEDLSGSKGFSYPWELAMHVAGWARHAAAVALRGEDLEEGFINSYIQGHAEPGFSEVGRMSFAPLPSIGHTHADGRIRRVMLVEPAEADDRATRLLRIKLPGWPAIDERSGATVCYFTPPADRRTVVRLYTAQARTWRSVTPVVVHGHNALRGRVSIAKTERLLVRAFEMAGYAESAIRRVTFRPAPLWSGTGAARAIRTPSHLGGFPRYHVEVEFHELVSGPVLAGIGRHCGLGVFAADSS